MNIDWELFKKQKESLIVIRDGFNDFTEEFETLSGVIHLMDAIQDKFTPTCWDAKGDNE